MVRLGTAPAGILALHVESILSAGSIIAKELYGRWIPMYTLRQDEYVQLKSCAFIRIEESGAIVGS